MYVLTLAYVSIVTLLSCDIGAVLKVVALEAAGFTEKRNLRVVGKPSLNFSTNDIRWHPRTSLWSGERERPICAFLDSFGPLSD